MDMFWNQQHIKLMLL